MEKDTKILSFGALAGAATPLVLQYVVNPILNLLGQYTPEISAKLAQKTAPVISLNVRESITGINAGLSGWLADSLHLSLPTNTWMPYVMAAIGGAILFWLGAKAAEMGGWLTGNSVAKTRTVIFLGSAIAGFLIGGMAVPEFGITMVNSLIAMGINAAVLAIVLVPIGDQLGMTPF